MEIHFNKSEMCYISDNLYKSEKEATSQFPPLHLT